MQKFHLNTLFRGSSSSGVAKRRGVNAPAAWRGIIAFTIMASIVSVAGAVFYYKWVSLPLEITAIKSPEKGAMSAGEIREIVNFYKTKQSNFQELLSTRPQAPLPGRGAGVEVDVSSMSELGGTLNMETSVVVPVSRTP